MTDNNLFTSESVSEGHPDKVADQVSDAVLDAMLAQDKESRVACETLIKTGLIVVAGEVRSNAQVDIDKLVRDVVADIGYNSPDVGFDPESCTVVNALGQQSSDIAMGVDETADHEQGAGDQGLMFGYATDETDVLMPAPLTYSHRLVQKQAEMRRSSLKFLRPDAKSQLTFRYDADGKPTAIDAVVLSTQHSPDISQKDLQEAVMEEVIKPVLPQNWISAETKIYINPTGQFIIGGPVGDCGLTGRKIIVDTYGGMARHGGGAFSGKDPLRSTGLRLMLVAMWQKILSPQDWHSVAKSRSVMQLVSQNLHQSASIPLAQEKSAMKGSFNLCVNTLTCGHVG